MKSLFFLVFAFLFLSLGPSPAFAAGKEWVCWTKIRPHQSNHFKGCHASKAQAIRLSKASCLSYVKRMGYKWGSTPDDCYAGTCKQELCEIPPEPRDPSNPFCNWNSECGDGRVCLSGICRDKNDNMNNRCTSDDECGGPLDSGKRCHPFGYCE